MTESAGPKLVTFEQTSAAHLLDKLRREIKRIDDAVDRSYAQDHVTNAFWTAWSIHEWVWQAVTEHPHLKAAVLAYRGIDQAGVDDERSFGAALAGRFVPLKICRAIATSAGQAKVLVNDPSTASFASANMQERLNGTAQSFSKLAAATASNKPMIVIMGKPVSATRLLEEVEEYWITLIHECGIERLK